MLVKPFHCISFHVMVARILVNARANSRVDALRTGSEQTRD